jgi:RimJ/RimL family protein N-acetyltransferase
MTSLWPLNDLVLRTERLELRLPTDPELEELAGLIDTIHPPDFNPFYVAWTTGASPQREREFLQYHWRCRAEWSTKSWELNLVAFFDGRPVGSQNIGASQFGVTRSVSTGSYLGGEFQGRGLGKEMRLAVLALAFDGLGAEEAHTATRPENGASAGVTLALGYEPNGTQRLAYGGVESVQDRKYIMQRQRWNELHPDHGVTIDGLEGCLDMFGL